MIEVEKHSMLDEQFDMVFIHKGVETSFSTGINPLNGNWMYWWPSTGASMYVAENKRHILSIVRDIRKKSDGVIKDCSL